MKILQEHIEQVNKIDLTKVSHVDVWSDNWKECYDFYPERNFLRITKFYGKYRDYAITSTIDNYSKYDLTELNKLIKYNLSDMNEQSRSQGGLHGMSYSL